MTDLERARGDQMAQLSRMLEGAEDGFRKATTTESRVRFGRTIREVVNSMTFLDYGPRWRSRDGRCHPDERSTIEHERKLPEHP